eukprot:6460986-Prorocentrum_lima.AAC.1
MALVWVGRCEDGRSGTSALPATSPVRVPVIDGRSVFGILDLVFAFRLSAFAFSFFVLVARQFL